MPAVLEARFETFERGFGLAPSRRRADGQAARLARRAWASPPSPDYEREDCARVVTGTQVSANVVRALILRRLVVCLRASPSCALDVERGQRVGGLSVGQSNRGPGVSAEPVPDAGGRGVLEGAFELLGAVERAEGAGLTRLASECGLPKTTVYRLLEQLVELGAVERCRAGYRMGPRMFRLGQQWQPYPGMRAVAREPLRRLARATGATVGISVLSEGETLVLDWIPGEGTPHAVLHHGVAWPWFTAGGKVLAAAAYPQLPAGPVPTSWPQEAAVIRERGVAFDREQVVPGVCCVAVPVRDADGAVVATLSVSTDPAHHLERLAEITQKTSRAIGTGLRGR